MRSLSLMILFPAIDLKGGACVRLVKGDIEQATIYNENPGEQARAFMEIGFPWLHVVDLDGALAGEIRNEEALDVNPLVRRRQDARSARRRHPQSRGD